MTTRRNLSRNARGVVFVAFGSFVLVLSSSGLAVAGFAPKGNTLAAGVSSGGGGTAGPGNKVPSALDQAKANKGSITLGDDSGNGKAWGLVPPTHTVRKGDTLWDICDHYFNNPWQWPRVWSYNPDILNPHWIYPGELIHLKKEGGGALNLSSDVGVPTGTILKPKLVKPGTVFLRDQGFVYDDKTEDTGEIVGSPEDRMLLTTFNKVYVRVTKDQAKTLFPGDSLTVFHQARAIKVNGNDAGKVVQILGTVRVDKIDKDTNLVEGTIVEALDVIERGARVGPIERRIDIVPPTTNQIDLRGQILASVWPTILYGANQVVLIDKGEKQGVKVGNRIFVVRKGDAWRKGLSASGELAASSVTLNTDSTATVEKKASNTPEDAPDYPEEVIAEVRVLRVRDDTSTCIVTSSQREMEPGDTWVMKKGY
jgi:hypothetical protein